MGGTTPLSGGTQTVNLTPVGGTGVVATMTAGTPGSSTVTVTLALSEGATLVTWTLQKRGRADSGSAWSAWSNVATGITATDYDVTGLEPSPAQYEFQAIDVVTETTTTSNVVSVATGELPPVPLTLWSQIEGGLDLGNPINGGAISGWNTGLPATVQCDVKNLEAEAATEIEVDQLNTLGSAAATFLGVAMRTDGNTWTIDNTSHQVGVGSTPSPAYMLVNMPLLSPFSGGSTGKLQIRYSTGWITPPKSLGNGRWPTSSQGEPSMIGGAVPLGTLISSGSSYAPWTSRLYYKRASNPHYVFGVFGDSTTAPVVPTADTYNVSKEGWNFRLNNALRAEGKRVRVHSYGQGTASWDTIKARVRAILPYLVGKVSHILVLVWTWNSPWTTPEQVATAWAEYLALEAEVKEAGFDCSPLILHPYTTRTGTGQPEAFLDMRARAIAHGKGLILDSIFGDTSWPNLPAAWSQDNVHLNNYGATIVGPACRNPVLTLAATNYPEFAP